MQTVYAQKCAESKRARSSPHNLWAYFRRSVGIIDTEGRGESGGVSRGGGGWEGGGVKEKNPPLSK